MHGARAENTRLVDAVLAGLSDSRSCECVICPPAVYLAEIGRAITSTGLRLGAQNVCAETQGAFTGEISVGMLREVGCEFVIVGHSERRSLYLENDAQVARKFAAVIASGITPILCVGESLAERESGSTESVVSRQLDAVVALAGVDSFASAVIAYEPVWAIGTGRTATPEQAEEVHRFIRGRLAGHDAKIAGLTRILYGGSVKAVNAAELFAKPNVDGGLIGGASLKADEFLAIVAAANSRYGQN